MSLKKWGRCVSAVLFALLAVTAVAQIPSSQRVILVIDENTKYSDVLADMPWLVSQGNAYGYASNYLSDNGGSLMDYLWLASGSCHSAVNCTLPPGTHDFGCNGNDCTSPITDDSIFREMNNAGISWKVYAQSYAAAGGTVTTPDRANGTSYYRRHNGATWYSDILSNIDNSADNVVDLSQLSADQANGTLPRYMIIAPDGNHDAHDCPVGMNTCTEAQKLSAADAFLSSTLTPLLATPDFQPGGDGMLIITFDECGGGTDKGCGSSIYTAVIGPKVIPHTVSAVPYKHENALRTMLDALQITTYPGASATAIDMSDFFTTNKSKPQVTVTSPANGATVDSPVTIQAVASPTAGHAISGWYIYVDSVAVWNKSGVSSINASVSMTTGAHTVLVRAWDTSGAFGDQTLTLTIATKPVVTVSTPTNGSNVISPINVQASATPTSGRSISGWYVYVDGVAAFHQSGVSSINTNITASSGQHTVLVRAWDTSGAFGDQSLSLDVQTVAVNISTPANGAIVTSPVNVQATASSSKKVTGWYIYVDSQAVYSQSNGDPIDTDIALTSGTHTMLVRAWNSTGAFGDQTITLIVQ
jgi:hypothetical protein